MTILIDNGHGADTPGKHSPDLALREWKWAREIAADLQQRLRARGLDARLLVPEARDVPLDERAARANAVCDAILVSIHANAAGRGEWMNARGWCCFVAPAAGVQARHLATLLAREAESQGISVRRPSPGRDYWQARFAICRLTRCPAVLTENCFMDNHLDCQWMLSAEGREAIISLHETAILRYLGILPGAGG